MTDYPVAVRDVSPSTVGGGRVIDAEARFIDEDEPRTPSEKDFGKRKGGRQNIGYEKKYADKGTPERTRHSKAESKFKKATKVVSEAASTVARKSAPVVEKAAVTTGRLAKQGLEETFDVDISSDDRGYTVKRRKHKRRVVKKRVVKKRVVKKRVVKKKVVKRRKTSPRSGTSPRRESAPRSATSKKVVKKAAPKKKRSSQVDKWADSDWFI